MSSSDQAIKSRKRAVRQVNPVAETIKIVLGGGFGLFLAVMVLSYFWGIDLLGWRKQPAETVASASPPPELDGLQRLMSERARRPAVTTPRPPDRPAPLSATAPDPEPEVPPVQQTVVESELVVLEQPATAPPKESTIPPDLSGGATLTVSRMSPIAIESKDVPEFLRGGTVYSWIDPPKAVNVELGEVSFVVERNCVVVLGENWKNQGGGGDWTATRLTREQLVQNGWEPCGTVVWPPDEPQLIELFRKVCLAGEHYTIRTNKYWPPAIFVPPVR